MNYSEWFNEIHPKPKCLGIGLIALDIVVNHDVPPRLWAGGSCGNVIMILSYLGWETHPIARLGNDKAAEELKQDMERLGVKTDLIQTNSLGSTPIIIEKIGISQKGIPYHRFEWICPKCQSWLPGYKPVLAKDVERICGKIADSQVFYLDRVSRSSVELAKIYKERGSLIFFEPSGIKQPDLFRECLSVADIVKYSRQRNRHIQELTQEIRIPLEIETLGSDGLRYRVFSNGKTKRRWEHMPSYCVQQVRDTAGAGDWCSAGIIHALMQTGQKDTGALENINTLLNFGQALGALNCQYEGARGTMYNTSKHEFRTLVMGILEGMIPKAVDDGDGYQESGIFASVCPCCRAKAEKASF